MTNTSNFITSKEFRFKELLQKLNIRLSETKNFNIHIPTKQLNQISVFGNKLLNGATTGYSFIVFHDYRRGEDGYTYNINGKITIGYLSSQKIHNRVTQGDVVDNNIKYVIDYLREDILFEGKISDVNNVDDVTDIDNNTLSEENKEETLDDNSEHSFTQKQNQDKFTKREMAAILLKVPDSGLPWLDNLIKKSRDMDEKR